MAQNIIRTVAQQTQDELTYHISDLVSLAMEAVFGDSAYSLKVEFPLRRGRTECDINFIRAGQAVSPLQGAGGGAVDVAAFALRVALWSLMQPRTRPVIVLDEPFRFLSRDLHSQASTMLREVSGKLGVQIIMVTHSEALTECADRIFEVQIKNGKSIVSTS